MSDAKLLPCPFCGMPVTLDHGTTDGVLCFACPEDSPCRDSGLGIFALERKRDTAVNAWNTRAAAARIAALEEAMRDLLDDCSQSASPAVAEHARALLEAKP